MRLFLRTAGSLILDYVLYKHHELYRITLLQVIKEAKTRAKKFPRPCWLFVKVE